MKKVFYPFWCVAMFQLFFSCKKEAEIYKSNVVASADTANAKTDGIITVQAGILPPVTQSTFIANGGKSIAEFQISVSQRVFIYQLFFAATYPAINSITINGANSQPNAGGTIQFNGSGPYIKAGGGLALRVQVNYNLVDSTSSGTVAALNLTRIVYRTEDEVYHDFYAGNAGKAQPMCLVKNVPEIKLINPGEGVLKNGYRQIAAIRLAGDEDYSINAIPLKIETPFSTSIQQTNLVLRYNGKDVATVSDPIHLQPFSFAQTVVRFPGGFKHTAGEKEVIRIYAPVSGYKVLLTTTMFPINEFIWTDGLGVRLNKNKNERFFTGQTGKSVLL